MSEVLNIRTKAASQTHTFDLLDGEDEPLGTESSPVKVTVFGPGSKQFQKAKSTQENRLLARMKKKGNADQSPEEKRKQQAEFLADVTQEFIGMGYDDLTGREMLLAIYSDPEIGYIAEQVSKAAHDWANFTKRSATT